MKTERKLLLKPLLLTLLLSLAALSLHLGWWGSYSERELLERLFQRHWLVAWPLFVAVGALYTALGGPRQFLAFSCGYLLGGFSGALVSTAITVMGALLVVAWVRGIAMERMRKRHGERIAMLQRLLAGDSWLWICMVRLMPVGSNLLTNIAIALTGLSLPALLWGSLLGYLPQMLLFSYAGAGVALQDATQFWISLLLLVLSSALAFYLYHHGFKQRLQAIREEHHAHAVHSQR